MSAVDESVIERVITKLLLRYAHAVDRRDYDAVARCYWPDAIAESALRLVRLRSALEELARAGVIYRQPAPTMLQTGYAMIPT